MFCFFGRGDSLGISLLFIYFYFFFGGGGVALTYPKCTQGICHPRVFDLKNPAILPSNDLSDRIFL